MHCYAPSYLENCERLYFASGPACISSSPWQAAKFALPNKSLSGCAISCMYKSIAATHAPAVALQLFTMRGSALKKFEKHLSLGFKACKGSDSIDGGVIILHRNPRRGESEDLNIQGDWYDHCPRSWRNHRQIWAWTTAWMHPLDSWPKASVQFLKPGKCILKTARRCPPRIDEGGRAEALITCA